jgi:hypothetical protein
MPPRPRSKTLKSSATLRTTIRTTSRRAPRRTLSRIPRLAANSLMGSGALPQRLGDSEARRIARSRTSPLAPLAPRRSRPNLMNLRTMAPCGPDASRGTKRLLTRGALSYSVIPGAQRDQRHPLYVRLIGKNVVCASEITMDGRLQVRPTPNGSSILQVVSYKPPQVRKGDVLLIERGMRKKRGVISGLLGPFGVWDVRWRASRLLITPIRAS